MKSAGNRIGNGYTLIEVLVSLAILMFSLTVIGRLMRSSMLQTVNSEEETEVQIVCRNTLDSILSGALSITPRQMFPMPGFPDWEIQITCVQGVLPGITEICLNAQKYELTDANDNFETDGAVNSFSDGAAGSGSDKTAGRIPVPNRRIFLKQWAQTSSIHLSGQPLAEMPGFDTDKMSETDQMMLEARIGDGTFGSGTRAEDVAEGSSDSGGLPDVFVPDRIETTDIFESSGSNGFN